MTSGPSPENSQIASYAKDPIKVITQFFIILYTLLADYELFEYDRPQMMDYIVFEQYKGEKISGGSKSKMIIQ